LKIAYIIIAHKLPEQLVRLVKKLNTVDTSFFIHVDRKTDEHTYRMMVDLLQTYDNVQFLMRRVVNWGTFSQVQVTLDGIREANSLKFEFDYAILLTGQDYPIKSNEYISKFLQESEGKSYIEYFSLPNEIWKSENGGMDRFNYLNLNFLGRPRKIFPRFDLPYQNFLNTFKIFGGSAYWCLAKDCVEFINEYLDQDESYIKFWKYTRIPDEAFFQTVLLNSQFKNRLINDNCRYIVWYSGPHPEILTKQEYEQFIGSDKLFARKFDVTVDSEVLDMIDSEIS